MLAYLFWHRPRPGVDPAAYEEALRAFHGSLDGTSASFRLARLPFADVDGYEDWYLVDDWQALGALNTAAVDARHRAGHDSAAHLAGVGWGGLYGLVRGSADVPGTTRWLAKPPDLPYDEFLGTLPDTTVWQRQMVLSPAPEFCVAGGDPTDRRRLL